MIAAIQGAPTDADLLHLRDALVQQAGLHRAQGLVVDVTALDVMDSSAILTPRDIAQTIRLCGVVTVVVGIDPDVAPAMVRLGLDLQDVAIRPDLEDGLAFLEARRAGARGDLR